MQTTVKSIKILLKAERIIAQQRFRSEVFKLQFVALAVLIATIGVVMFSVSLFFALETPYGKALAALIVGVVNLVLATALIFITSKMKPGRDFEMARIVRDSAIEDIESDVDAIVSEVKATRNEVRDFVQRPASSLLPYVAAPAVEAALKGLGKKSKSKG